VSAPGRARPWDRTAPEKRSFSELGSEGLTVQAPPRRPDEGPGGWSPATGGAWIHVAPDGTVHAFTGKVDVGQGTRLALRLIVAEELRIPVGSVELTMADTDRSPWDMGTFGSRSMPDAASTLQMVAAATRRTLEELAALRWGLRPDQVSVVPGGRVRRGQGPEELAWGEIVGGRATTRTVEGTASITRASDWRTAGRSARDSAAALDVVTGRRTYPSDIRRPGQRYGVLLHPPRYGDRLGTLDASAIAGEPDVRLVRAGEFVGVVAPTPGRARAALARLRATWRSTPQPRESEIETYLRGHPASGDDWDTDELRTGEVSGALERAASRIRGTYRAAYIAHVPLEPRCAVAEWADGRVTVWVGTQTPFRARDAVAEGLGLPPEDVRVVVPPTGAGFGGKHGGDVGLAAALLAREAGVPVQVAFGREEEFRFGYFRPYALIDAEAGADAEGRLTAWSFHNVNAGAAGIRVPYDVPNQRIDNELSETPLRQGPYRALAATANNFARESLIDELARDLGIGPVEFREKNLSDERLRAVLAAAVSRAGGDRSSRPPPGRGRGVAIGREKGGRVATIAEVSVAEDRTLTVDRLVTAFEAGAIVHPDGLRSQVEGATMMGLGGALFEAIHFDEGVVRNARLSEYRVPRFSDVPRIETVLLDRKEFPPAGGGETPIIAVAPAIANAIFDATGVRLRALPLVPDGKVPEGPSRARA
jgi:nicotinate dehydrogenase subunit B